MALDVVVDRRKKRLNVLQTQERINRNTTVVGEHRHRTDAKSEYYMASLPDNHEHHEVTINDNSDLATPATAAAAASLTEAMEEYSKLGSIGEKRYYNGEG